MRSRRRSFGPWGPAGFTLIELVLVALVLTTLLGAAVPVFRRTTRRLALETSVWRFSSFLGHVRELSVLRRSPVRVLVEHESGSWRSEVWSGDTGRFESRGANRGARPGHVSKGVLIRAPAAGIVFYPDGTSDDAHVEILAPGENRVRLHLSPFQGLATEEMPVVEG